jgi:hypothetical protein
MRLQDDSWAAAGSGAVLTGVYLQEFKAVGQACSLWLGISGAPLLLPQVTR